MNKHLQTHNMWPMLWAIFLFCLGLIFTSGQIYNRFVTLETNSTNYQKATNDVIYRLEQENERTLERLDQYEPRVKGVSTSAAILKITPVPSPTRRPTFKPTPTEAK